MSRDIFPADIVENTQESNFEKHNVRLRIINWIILFIVILAMIALPLVEIDVGLRGQGLIRPVTEVVQITSPVSGKLQELYITENAHLWEGDVIARINSFQLAEQIRHTENRKKRLSMFLQDLGYLLEFDLTSEPYQSGQPGLKTERYLRSYQEIRQKLAGLRQNIGRYETELERQQYLSERELTSSVNLEEAEFHFQNAVYNFTLAAEQQKNRWQVEQLEFQNELEELQSQLIRFREEIGIYTIQSPVTGTVQNLAAIYRNSFIHPNQVLAEISPDTNLVAATYVRPGDIGLLREGMQVRFSIDAFNQNQWGTIDGEILEISTDAIMMDQTPVFRVLCSLSQTYLELKSGVRGDLKKGMTLQARFIVARRTLLQLLFDNVDDWLNPLWGASPDQDEKDRGMALQEYG